MKALNDHYHERLCRLNLLLDVSLESLKPYEINIRNQISNLKQAYRDFSSSNHELICALYRVGSYTEARDLKFHKKEKSEEVTQMVTLANSVLRDLGASDNLSDIASSTSSADQNLSGRAESVINDFSKIGLEVSTSNIGTESICPGPAESIDVGLSNIEIKTSVSSSFQSNNIAETNVISREIPVRPLTSILNPKTYSLPSNSNNISLSSYLPTLNVLQPSTANEPCQIKNDSLAFPSGNVPSTSHSTTRIGISSISNRECIDDFAVNSACNYAAQPPHPLVPMSSHDQSHPIVSSQLVQPPYGEPPQFQRLLQCRRRMFSRPLQCRHRMLNRLLSFCRHMFRHPPLVQQPHVQPSPFVFPHAQHQPIVMRDHASMYLIKQQLFQKSSNPYRGDPEMFNSWINSLENRTIGLNLSPYDFLLLLRANTAAGPFDVIQKHMAIGGNNPTVMLENTLSELRSEYGCGVKIAKALVVRLDLFPIVKSPHGTKLKELHTSCLHIEANMSSCPELEYFNSGYGVQKVWVKMPDSLQNSYRTASDDYRARNNGSCPPFSFIVQFLSKKCRELSDAYFHRSPLTFESRKKEPTKTAQAFTSKLDENQNISSNKAVHLSNQSKVSCLLHDNSKHNLSDCHKFAKLPHSEKINLLKKNRCCFKCFGNHMKSNCSVSVKCDRCLGSHLTAMHIDRNDSADTNPDSTKSSMCTKTCNDPSSLKDCSKVVLVDLSLKGSDKQSNSSFVDPKIAEYSYALIVSPPQNSLNFCSYTSSYISITSLDILPPSLKSLAEAMESNLIELNLID